MRAVRRWRRGSAPPPTPTRAGSGSTQVVFLHVVAERPEAHAEQFSGLDLNSAGTAQRLRDVAALDLLDVRFEVEARLGQDLGRGGRTGARTIAAHAARQAVGQNRLRRLERDGA